MKRMTRLYIVALAVLICSQLFSQAPSLRRSSLSLGAELGIPTGTLNETQNLGIGGSLKALFPVFEGGALTLSAGYISFSGDKDRFGTFIYPAQNFIPIKAGLRYNIVPRGSFYLEPQLGYTSIATANSNTSGHGGFTFAANLGAMLQAIDLSVRYEAVYKDRDSDTRPFIGLRAAYNFKL